MSQLELAAKVEAAEGPDSVLDAEIDCAIRFPHLRPAEPTDFEGKFGYSPGNIKTEHGFLQASRYTASLDAALTLVPEGWAYAFSSNLIGAGNVAGCQRRDTFAAVDATAATPALALAAAALRARADAPEPSGKPSNTPQDTTND